MISYSTTLRTTLMTTTAGGGLPFAQIFGNATLRIYTGDRVATADTAADAGNLCLEITGLSFTTATAGKVSKPTGTTWSAVVSQTATVTWFRMSAATGQSLDGDVGMGEDLRFLSHSWEALDTITIDALSFEMFSGEILQ